MWMSEYVDWMGLERMAVTRQHWSNTWVWYYRLVCKYLLDEDKILEYMA